MPEEDAMTGQRTQGDYDVIVVGAGFGGMYALYRLRGLGHRVRVLEAGTDVGGTWYWNRYPGARVDTETMFYSYQFSNALQQEWDWKERYPSQPEILEYARHVADRFDLRPDIQFEARVRGARWDDATDLWTVETEDGTSLTARFCVMATGCLSAVNIPKFEGADCFVGELYHTGLWPDAPVSLAGKRVAVIGAGSSGVQSIPVFAEQAEQLFVFQRTANYVIPSHNRRLDPSEIAEIKANYPELRAAAKKTFSGNIFSSAGDSAMAVSDAERNAAYEERWQTGGLAMMATYADFQTSEAANETVSDFIRGKIREIVDDPEVAELLAPKQLFLCKRLCVGTDYYETYNRDNVTLVDVSESPIERFTPNGLQVDGTEYEVDVIVLATGFDAMTGALNRMDIRGVDGLALRDKWADGPKTYLGLGIAGFPNMFTITGPGSPSVLTNMIPSIEQHVEWISDCIEHMRAHDLTRIEAETDAEEAWVENARNVAGLSLRAKCESWYLGSNIPGKPRVMLPFAGGMPVYAAKCNAVAAAGYDGFALD
jgi:cation diffusion facilitator CzcD-associated flavoprotein CzcO